MKQPTLMASILLGVCVLGGCGSGNNKGGELVDAQENKEKAQKGLSQAQSALEDMEQNLEGLREEKSELSKELEKLSKKNEELEKEVKNLQNDLSEEREARQKAEALLKKKTDDEAPETE